MSRGVYSSLAAWLALCAAGALAIAQDPEPVSRLPVRAPVPARKGATPVPPQPRPASDTPADAVPPDDPASAAPLDYTAHATQETFANELGRLASAHGPRVRVSSLGQSRGARELALLTIGELASGDPDRRPALLVVSGLDPAFDNRPAGPEAALHVARALLEKAVVDPATAQWLARTTVYVVPAPDPDPLFARAGAPARACRLDRNFPAEWKPWSSESCAQGPYPLSEPETRALARFVADRRNIGAVLLLTRASPTEVGAASIDELERVLCQRLGATTASSPAGSKEAGQILLERVSGAMGEPGSLAAFCRARLSAFVVPVDPFGEGIVESSLGKVPGGFPRLLGVLERLAHELPQVACRVVKQEQLRERLWLVDVDLENLGLLPTIGPAARGASPGSVWFESTGGRVAQVGIARSGAAASNAVERRPGVWMIGHLDGRETVQLHVVVEAATGAELDLVFKTLREGESRCASTLR